MKTRIPVVLFITVLVIAFTFTSPIATLNAGVTFVQQQDPAVQAPTPADKTAIPRSEQNADKKLYFLKDLDKALKEGCGAFYKYTGAPKYAPAALVCVDGASSSVDMKKFIAQQQDPTEVVQKPAVAQGNAPKEAIPASIPEVPEKFKPLIGIWKAVTPSPGRMGAEDRWEFVVKGDGSFLGDIQSARGGLIPLRDGRYKIVGDTVIFEAIAAGGPREVNGQKYTWTLNWNGEDLEGAVARSRTVGITPMIFRRVR